MALHTSERFRALLEHARAFVLHDLLSGPLVGRTPEELAELWAVVDHVVRLLETRKEDLRQALLAEARRIGKETEKGHRLDLEGGLSVRRTLTGSITYLADQTLDLLTGRALPVGRVVFNQTKVVPAVRVDALLGLRDAGYLSDADLESVRKPQTVTLTVDQDDALLDLIEERLPLLDGMKRKGGGSGGSSGKGNG